MTIESLESRLMYAVSITPTANADPNAPLMRSAVKLPYNLVSSDPSATAALAYNPGELANTGKPPLSLEEFLAQPIRTSDAPLVIRPASQLTSRPKVVSAPGNQPILIGQISRPNNITIDTGSDAARNGLLFNPGDDLEKGNTPLSLGDFWKRREAGKVGADVLA